MAPVDLTSERWLKLLELSRVAAALPLADPADLRVRADRMREAPAPGEGSTRCIANAFRWACLWFATAPSLERVAGAEALTQLGDQLARHLRPTETPPPAAAAAQPVPDPEAAAECWNRRADCGGA